MIGRTCRSTLIAFIVYGAIDILIGLSAGRSVVTCTGCIRPFYTELLEFGLHCLQRFVLVGVAGIYY